MQTTFLLKLECGHEVNWTGDANEKHLAPRTMYCSTCEQTRDVTSVEEDPRYQPG